jgi:cysteinyl-tRNA synthetase
MHNGLLNTGGEKMSKSLGNSYLVSDLLQRVRPQVLRYYLGAAHYRSTVDFTDAGLDEAATAFGRIETFVRNAVDALGGVAEAEAAGMAGATGTAAGRDETWVEFEAAMDDDLGVPQALAVVHNAVRAGNSALADGDRAKVAATLASTRRMLEVLALDPVSQWPFGSSGSELEKVVDALVRLALDARQEARARRDFAAADAIRDRLHAAGIVVEDTADGARWRLAGAS